MTKWNTDRSMHTHTHTNTHTHTHTHTHIHTHTHTKTHAIQHICIQRHCNKNMATIRAQKWWDMWGRGVSFLWNELSCNIVNVCTYKLIEYLTIGSYLKVGKMAHCTMQQILLYAIGVRVAGTFWLLTSLAISLSRLLNIHGIKIGCARCCIHHPTRLTLLVQNLLTLTSGKRIKPQNSSVWMLGKKVNRTICCVG